MKLEQQVTSLELSKRLKDLGVGQDSYYIWKIEKEKYEGEITAYVSPKDGWKLDAIYGWLSAFTVAELGEMLPWDITIHRDINLGWHITYQANGKTENDMKFSESNNEAETRGLMLAYLIENNLITV